MMHIFSMKEKTKKSQIVSLKAPSILHIPLLQHVGNPAEPLVKAGDRVKKYQLIGQAGSGISANIHSPVSGTVINIEDSLLANGRSTLCIVIENDGIEEVLTPTIEEKDLDEKQIIEIIRSSGIVGAGGAQFPTDIKYNIGEHPIHTFIINGTECEPYLTADYALMTQYTEQLLKGIIIANKVLNAEDIIITIEEQNKELVEIFAPFLQLEEYKKIRIIILPNEYPQGGELQLIKSVTGIELSRSKRPREIGIIVNNVGTIYAIYQAVVNRRPVISRFLTISGERAKRYGNFEVLIGTPISHILQELNLTMDGATVVLGGPLMGQPVIDINTPVVKGTSGVLFLEADKKRKYNCISCGYCVDVCPMRLMPMKFDEINNSGRYFKLGKYNINNCIECGACEYICPSNIPLVKSIKEGKIKLKQLANAIE